MGYLILLVWLVLAFGGSYIVSERRRGDLIFIALLLTSVLFSGIAGYLSEVPHNPVLRILVMAFLGLIAAAGGWDLSGDKYWVDHPNEMTWPPE